MAHLFATGVSSVPWKGEWSSARWQHSSGDFLASSSTVATPRHTQSRIPVACNCDQLTPRPSSIYSISFISRYKSFKNLTSPSDSIFDWKNSAPVDLMVSIAGWQLQVYQGDMLKQKMDDVTVVAHSFTTMSSPIRRSGELVVSDCMCAGLYDCHVLSPGPDAINPAEAARD